jgi:predicted HicB family RNase H-like nuclease
MIYNFLDRKIIEGLTVAEKKRGRPPKLVDPETFPLRLPADLKLQLQHYALDQRRSLNEILIEWIQSHWKARRGRSQVTEAQARGE